MSGVGDHWSQCIDCGVLTACVAFDKLQVGGYRVVARCEACGGHSLRYWYELSTEQK